VAGVLLLLPLVFPLRFYAGADLPSAEERALTYLAREVPRWKAENNCYSCHNNGDAARALFAAVRQRRDVPAKAIEDTVRFLALPAEWDKNGPEGPFKDKKLARIQFATALGDAIDTGVLKDRKPLVQAAELIAELQAANGSFPIEGAEQLGSPVTYGLALTTVRSRQTLLTVDRERYRGHIARADAWLADAKVESLLDAAALLLVEPNAEKRRQYLDLIRRGQSKDGGWGPYTTSPSEAFDTAIVLLTLVKHRAEPEVDKMIAKGRGYLLATQQPDGSWPETTRPPRAESYAQRLSTTGWATLALLAAR